MDYNDIPIHRTAKCLRVDLRVYRLADGKYTLNSAPLSNRADAESEIGKLLAKLGG
jgi:hypothetical protein